MLDLCRICLVPIDQPSSFSIYFKIFYHKSILEVMQECSSIELMEEESLPKFICSKCRDKLYSLYEFRNLIINSETQLKNEICVKKENTSSDENYGNVECLPFNVIKIEAKEELSVEENLTKQIPGEKTSEETVLEEYKHIKKKRIRLYKCKQCNLDFKSTYSLEKHNEEHTGIKPFVCEICGKGYLIKAVLQAHKSTHTGEKPFSCDICQKNFSSYPNLYIHKKIHNGEKKFFCEVCKKGFFQSCNLVYHMRLHTGEKPYMCEVCSKTFRERSSLIRHKERHQENVEKVPCPTCGSSFERRYLQKHMKGHSELKPFECDVCGQKYKNQTTFKRHKLLHSGVKSHKCKVCEKSFSQGGILMRHMRIHSGEKPFACTVCPKEFAYKHHLQQHVRIYHQDVKEDTSEEGLDTEKWINKLSYGA